MFHRFNSQKKTQLLNLPSKRLIKLVEPFLMPLKQALLFDASCGRTWAVKVAPTN